LNYWIPVAANLSATNTRMFNSEKTKNRNDLCYIYRHVLILLNIIIGIHFPITE